VSKKKSRWRRKIKAEQDYICPVCGKKGTDKTLNIHHKRPKARKGTSVRSNVVAWHKTCHQNYHHRYGLQESDDFGNPI